MLDFLFSQYKEYSFFFIFLEITAVLFGVISVLFARKNNILVYPTGLISTLIFIYILYNFTLFEAIRTIINHSSLSHYVNLERVMLLGKKFILLLIM